MNKPPGRQKPKPPPYPRPVPQFVVEELPPTASDIAWGMLNGGGYYSDDEKQELDDAEVERRAAKRRRIEICAQACLRGEPLYLMSAQLKGPFKKGWRNPWSKKRRLVQLEEKPRMGPVEIPETAKKIVSSVDERTVAKIPVPTLQSRPMSRQSLRTDVSVASPARDLAPSPFTSRVTRITHETSPKLHRETKEKRVEEWLHTNDNLPRQNDVLVHSSPTPTASRRKTPGQQQGHGNKSRASQSEPPRIGSPVVDCPRSIVSVQEAELRSSSRAERRIQKLSRDMQNMISEPAVQPSTDLQDEVRRLTNPSSSSKSHLDSSRAEFAILRAKRNILHTAPADAHMSPFEFRKVASSGEPQVKQKTASTIGGAVKSEAARKTSVSEHRNKGGFNISVLSEVKGSAPQVPEESGKVADEIFLTAPQPPTQQKVVESAQQAILENDRGEERAVISTSQPALSHAVSDTNVTDVLPSAQPRPELETSLSNPARDERLLSIKNISSTVDNPGQAEEVDKEHKEDVVAPAATMGAGTVESALNQHTRAQQGVDAITPVPVRVAAQLSTQEMLANIEPLEMSTIKKLKSSPKMNTPPTTTKPKLDKKRKKTSFAFDHPPVSSNGSIKDVMKAKVSKKLGSPPLFLLGKADLDIDVSDEENESQRKRPRRMSSASKPKGILKSVYPSSSPNSLRKSRQGFSTGQEQDGEQRILPPGSGQNQLDGDNFDLDAAIDDLGSFLGTWDAEKEASSLDIEA